MTLRYASFRFQLIVLIALAFHTLAFAQPLHIAKDNFACLYGLKNAKGEWVVPASYSGISPTTNGYFITQADRDRGLIDSTGKIIFSPRYTEIKSYPQDWNDYSYGRAFSTSPKKIEFLIVSTQNRRSFTGLIDLNGKIILPLIYAAIMPSDDLLIARDSLGQEQCLDKTGNALTKKFTHILPTPDEQCFICYNGSLYAPGTICGVINRAGDTLVPFQYALIHFANQCFICTTEDKHYTLLDSTGKKMLRGSYTMISERDRYFTASRNDSSFFFNEKGELLLSIVGYMQQWQARKYYDYSYDRPDFTARALYKTYLPDKGYTLMNRSGVSITGEYYEAIDFLPAYQTDLSCYRWTFLKNKKMGALDTSGRVCIPAIYDSILFISGADDEHPCVVLRNNHHYALYNDSTKKSSAFIYDDYTLLGFNRLHTLFFSGKTDWCIYDFKNGKTISANRINTLRKFPNGASLCALDKDYRFVIERTANQSWNAHACQLYPSQDYFIEHIGDSDYLISRDGKVCQGPVQEIISEIPGRLIMISKKGRATIVDQRTGKVRADTGYFALAPNVPSTSYYWVKPKRTATCKLDTKPPFVQKLEQPNPICVTGPVYIWSPGGAALSSSPPPPPPSTCDCGWALADSTGKMITGALFGKPFSLEKKIQVAYGNNGAGLFDGRTMKFITPTVYYSINAFAKRYFSVITFSGKFGIIDSTGRMLADTIWESATPVFDGDLKRISKQAADTNTKAIPVYRYNEPIFVAAFRNNNEQHFRDAAHYPASWLLEKPGAKALFTENGRLVTTEKEVNNFVHWARCPQAWQDSVCSNSEIYFPAHRDSNWSSAARDLVAKRLAEKKTSYQQYTASYNNSYGSYGYPGQSSHRQFSSMSNYLPLSKTTPQWYEITYAKKMCCAVTHHVLVDHSGYYDIGPATLETYYENYRRDGERLVPLRFSDLVQGDTAAIFQSLLADALRRHDELTMSCVQAEKLFETGKSHFYISDAGIMFLYPDFTNYMQGYISLLVPWKALLPYAKENGIVAECAATDQP